MTATMFNPPILACRHGLDAITGYVIRRTFFSDRPHVDEYVLDGADRYGEALDRMWEIRNESNHDGYAVIDPVYECGCRGRG